MTGIVYEDDGTVTHFAWPGGYRVWYGTADGGTLCAECVTAHRGECEDQTRGGNEYNQWRVEYHWHEGETDSPDYCEHCNRTSDINPESETP